MQDPERLTSRDDAIGFAVGLVLVLVGVFLLEDRWAFAVGAVGVSFWLEALMRAWRRRG